MFRPLVKLLAALLLAAPAPAAAHTFMQSDFTCPLDGHKFAATVDGSGTRFGQRLDLKPLGPTPAPWRIPVCPRCGYVLYKKTKQEMSAKERKLLPRYIRSKAYRRDARGESSYYRLGLIWEHLGSPPGAVAYAYLRASWQVERQPNRYRVYLERALKHYRAALGKGGYKKGGSVTTAFLVGEIERQLGRFGVAKVHFSKLQGLAAFNKEPFATMIPFELQLIKKRDSKPHAVPRKKP